ncbi:TetR/AcrR family transcriptional regulator (plasmid) [Paraburkholderia sprentiae WSM5005]|uniref:TetR/AcrR family transcriptional regulator n=1 Tax=Paraburkholderia sprentiae WSM5005 TaxID=754502 RepID=A0A1I9YUK4_9BURK|nr:TetR/AcrR family transcriptional regulator [Paraburkholderia sprentiae]APA90569.1 TetR/AcrR family transcriptional regulator [Paraburkholderia sprentiae WSM5005]
MKMTDMSVPARRRARRSNEEVPRDKILRAAAALFRSRGYKGTTVRDIADSVGLLSGSLFHHFASKEEMLVEIMREAFLTVSIGFDKVLAADQDPYRQLRELIRLELDAVIHDERKDFHMVLYFDWRDAPPSALQELKRYRARYRDSWIRTLHACHESGLLRCDPVIAEQVIFGSLRHAMTWLKPGGKYTTEDFGDALVRLVLEEQ